MHFTAVILLNFNIFVYYVYCYSFKTNDVILISENSVKNTYFSYSLLLQKGETVSSLIIGAPRNNNDPQLGGDIYKCDIDGSGTTSCIQYPAGRMIYSNTTNGNFFGMSLDGENHVNGAVVACAPRTPKTVLVNSNFLRGYCIYMKNTSEVNQHPVEIRPLGNNGWYHDSACCDSFKRPFYDFGYAMAGFDVSFYSEKKREVLLGAPGVKKFNGITISYSIDDQGTSLLPTRNKPILMDEDTYFGYSVATAKFKADSDEVWFISGAPRSNYLKGKVMIYFYDLMAKERMDIVATFYGYEAGSYFGAAVLALDVTNDGNVDLLIGAPMAAGKTWDEGCVYFYKSLNEKSYLQGVKLTGSGQNGSRFGTAVVTLGDLDLDGFNDIAISAPYEDDGRGAVYVYRGSSAGLTDDYSQRLTPTDFSVHNTAVKGFGLGISRGNDIDGNGHNDVAIGAYKSDQVFIIKSYSIIDYQFFLTPSINSITNDTAFDIKLCILYTKRSDKNILSQATFNLSMDLDYRSIEGKIVDRIDADLGKMMCKNYQVQLRPTISDISPFQIDFTIDTQTENIIAHGEKSMALQIPYSHGCGVNNICEPDLSIELIPKSEKLVLGSDKEIDVTIKVNNYGEPAYQCEVKIEVPNEIELRNNIDCTKSGRNYTCLFGERLISFNEKVFIFDVKDIKPYIRSLEVIFQVTSSGNNKGGYEDKASLIFPIVLESTPYLVGKSIPDTTELETKSNITDVEVTHLFSVRKTGPSPLELNIDILIPSIEHNGENVFNILEVKGNIDTIQVPCTPSIIQEEPDFSKLDDLNVVLNRTILVSCNSEENCKKYTCQGQYLYNSEQVAIFEAKILIRSNLLVSKYKRELTKKDLIGILPMIFQNSPKNSVGSFSLFLIFVHGVHFVPLWVYLVAPTIGVILLMLVSYCLYRCHFFDRVYKDKLDQEKILEPNDGSLEEEIFDDVVFRPMEEKKQNDYI